MQIQSAYAEERRKEQIEEYKGQLEGVDLTRTFSSSGEPSLDGFTEILERYLELYKAMRTFEDNSLTELTVMMQIASLEQILSYVNDYRNGTLYDKYATEAQRIKKKFGEINDVM